MGVPWSLEEYGDPLLYDIENDGIPELIWGGTGALPGQGISS
ncbi:Uncharacterised protein [Chlamydia abortus]|nr:Uncharacterised protein [Chlamydia abortus]